MKVYIYPCQLCTNVNNTKLFLKKVTVWTGLEILTQKIIYLCFK